MRIWHGSSVKSTAESGQYDFDPTWKSMIDAQKNNLKKWSKDEILQLMRPAYPRDSNLDDLIVVSRID